MSNSQFFRLKDRVALFPKSSLLASIATGDGRYPFYLSGKKIGRIDKATMNEDAIIMGDGGVASIFFGRGNYSYSSHNFAFKSSTADLTNEYLFRLLDSFLDKIDYQGFVGSGLRNIDKKFLFNLFVDTPALHEQKKIVSILNSIDEVIEKTKKQIDKLQDLKKASMNELLIKGIAQTEFKGSELGSIPKSWEVKRLGEVAFFQRGHDLTASRRINGEFPVVSSSGITGYHNQSTTRPPSVLVGRKGSIGSVYFIERDFWAHDTSLYVINFFDNYEKFIFYLCVWLDLERYGTRSGSPSLNRNDIHPIKIAIPAYGEQKQISRIISEIEKKINLKIQRLNKTQFLKKSLMQDLLAGKVRVKAN